MSAPAVLVVEDDAGVGTTLCAMLTLFGYTPYRAGSVDAALRILSTERVDAAIVDVALPDWTGLGRSGLSLLAFLRATPVLILTGKQLSPDDDAVARKQNAEVFYKPQSYSVLISRITRLLRAGHAN